MVIRLFSQAHSKCDKIMISKIKNLTCLFTLFQLLDVAATDLLNKNSGSPATTPLHLVVSCFLCIHFYPCIEQ